MRLSANEAALLSKRELVLVRSRGPWHVADLAKAIRRTREMRDKQRDLLQRQQLALNSQGRSKGGNAGNANSRTEAKAALLDRVLQEFERRLADLDRESTEASQELLATGRSQRASSRNSAPRSNAGASRGAEARH
jgi:hypothetical protein